MTMISPYFAGLAAPVVHGAGQKAEFTDLTVRINAGLRAAIHTTEDLTHRNARRAGVSLGEKLETHHQAIVPVHTSRGTSFVVVSSQPEQPYVMLTQEKPGRFAAGRTNLPEPALVVFPPESSRNGQGIVVGVSTDLAQATADSISVNEGVAKMRALLAATNMTIPAWFPRET